MEAGGIRGLFSAGGRDLGLDLQTNRRRMPPPPGRWPQGGAVSTAIHLNPEDTVDSISRSTLSVDAGV